MKDFDIYKVKDIKNSLKEVIVVEGLKIHEDFVYTFDKYNHSCIKLISIQTHCQIKYEWIESKDFISSYHVMKN